MELDALFGGYRRALASGDVDAGVEYYGLPCLTLSDDFASVLTSSDDVRENLQQAAEEFAEMGMTDLVYDLQTVEQITDRIALVRLRWEVLGANGAPLLRLRYEYTVRDDDAADAPRIYAMVSLGDAEEQEATSGS
jgi:hypothetical protein